jgi:hypothetical protein
MKATSQSDEAGKNLINGVARACRATSQSELGCTRIFPPRVFLHFSKHMKFKFI